ncbi:hypothetical protein HHI36_021422 [Cryptolaemus montrouzieri]|uniref:CNH domain-containing protein n=1 Tax=Cryptolaemus montrouzieri TaxID=559131 RepID=A0ABD2MWQ3_9CUCU
MQKLVQSPSTQVKELSRNDSALRMHHNIPHRFESKLSTKPISCIQCGNSITIGRYMCVCKECDVAVHTNCSASLPSTCGLPQELVKHYQNTLNRNRSNADQNKQHKEDISIESWIKIPGESHGWEKRYATLTDSHIKIYTEPPNNPSSNLVDSFELKPEDSHGKIVLEPCNSEIDVAIAKSDLQFLMKVEIAPNTTCWPPKCLYFLTLSVQDKEMWYKALQKLFLEDNEKLYSESIMTVPDGLVVNCIIDVTDGIKAIGTNQGLLCYYNDNLLSLEGFTEVHHVAVVKQASALVMIVNSKNILISCDLNHLINVTQCTAGFAKASLKYDVVNIRGLNGFHMLETCKNGKHKMFCVATPKQLVIVGYNGDEREFVPLRILDTAEPTGTVLFTEHSIIVGADKFFEIDISTFNAEEFLDSSNPKLKHVLKCHQMKSYPLAAVEISENPKEYLIAFNEFSVFVDEFGSPSRNKEWTSTHLPLAVLFIKPYLYIIEFSAVEIYRITENTCVEEESVSDSIRINLEKFQFVGTTRNGIYVWHKDKIKLIEGKKVLPSDDSSVAESETENSSDRFSFTSSMVNSLDGHLDEENSEKSKEKCVTFAQTSF